MADDSFTAGMRLAAKAQVRGNRPVQLPPEDLGPGFWGTVLSPAKAVLDAWAWLNTQSRGLAGEITGTEGTGPITAWGTRAPSGRELLQLGQGEVGTFEAEDVAGFPVEMALDPATYLGLGLPTKLGRLAKEAAGLSAKLAAIEKSGITRFGGVGAAGRTSRRLASEEAAAIAKRLAEIGPVKAYGRTWAEQAAAGQRVALGLNLPFTRSVQRLLPREVDQALLYPFSKAGELAGKAGGRELYKRMFLREGRMPPWEPEAQKWNALHDLFEEHTRTFQQSAAEEAVRVGERLKGFGEERAGEALERFRTEMAPFVQAAIESEPRYARATGKLAALRPGIAERLAPNLDVTRGLDAGPSKLAKLWDIGVTRSLQGKKLEESLVILNNAYGQRIQAAVDKVAQLTAAGDAQGAIFARGNVTRLKKNLAARQFHILTKQVLNEEAWRLIPKELKPEILRFGTVTDDLRGQSLASKVYTPDLSDDLLAYNAREITAAGRMFQEDLQKAAIRDKRFAGLARVFSGDAAFTKQRARAFQGMGLTQVNDWVQRLRAQLAGAGISTRFGPKDLFFAEDPTEIILRRWTQQGRLEGTANLFRGAIESFWVPRTGSLTEYPVVDLLGKSPLMEWASKDIRKGAGDALKGTDWAKRAIPRDFAEILLRTAEATRGRSDEFNKAFDKWMSAMRFYVTVPALGYHLRDEITNFYMMWLGGFRNFGALTEAMRIQQLAKEGALLAGGGAKPEAREALRTIQTMARYGGLGGGMTGELRAMSARGGEIQQMGKGILGRIAFQLTHPTESPWGRWLINAASAVENHAKIAFYLDGIKQGLMPLQAVERVKKYLFNYADLSGFEKSVRRYAYFLTFMRKATPLMWEELFLNRRKVLAGLRLAGWGGTGTQEELLPEYARTQNPMAWSRAGGKQSYFNLGLPLEYLHLLSTEGKPGLSGVQRIGQRLLSYAAPPIRGLHEALSGQSVGSGRPMPLLRAVANVIPGGRAESFGRQIGRVQEGTSPLATLVPGLSAQFAEVNRAALRKRLLQLQDALAEKVERGTARVYPEYSQLRGQADPEVARLLSELGRTRKRLQRR